MYLKKNKNYFGIFCIVTSCFFFSLMSSVIKFCSEAMSLIEILFLRSIIGLFILIPIILYKKSNVKTNIFHFHFLRSSIGALAMVCMFYAITKLPLSNIIIISFSKIFFIIPLAFFFLNEKVRVFSLLLITLGFLV